MLGSFKRFKSMCQGFTLLEMMLVIIVIAAIAVAITQLISNQSKNAAVDKTATEMQMLLTAARNYYIDQPNNAWPTDITQLATAYKLNTTGPFGAYTLSFVPGYGSGSSGDLLPRSESITVSVTVPSATVADALIAQMPLASKNANHPLQVDAMTSSPGSSKHEDLVSYMARHNLIMIKSVYTDLVNKASAKTASNLHDNLSANNFVALTLPNCPSGWTPGYDLALTQKLWGQGSSTAPLNYLSLCKSQYNFQPSDSGTTTYYTVSASRAATAGSIWHTAGVLVITYCMPPNVVSNNSNILNKFNFDNTRTSGLTNHNNASSCYFGPFTGKNG